MGLAFPGLPQSVRASALLNGSDADFVINAYLALQRQWPDEGGFAHYRYVLSQPGGRRADVLRQIAASDNARRCCVEFIDDLPAEHDFRPEHHDTHRLIETHLSLRLGQTILDVAELRHSLSRLTAEQLVGAVEAMAQAQQAHHGVLESRIGALESLVESDLAKPAATTGSDSAARASDPSPADAHVRHLAGQQIGLLAELGETRRALAALGGQLDELKQAVAHLHHYTTVDLKREVADYVNALSLAQRSHETPPTSARTPVRAAPRAPARPYPRAAARIKLEHD